MLKPSRVEVDCVYSCNACGTETWYTVRELKHRTTLDCLCGTITRLAPVHSVDVVYAGKNTEKMDRAGYQVEPVGPQIEIDDFVVSLMTLGFKKSEATKLIEQNLHEYNGDEGQFITYLLAKGQ
jgi:hypothetical protein